MPGAVWQSARPAGVVEPEVVQAGLRLRRLAECRDAAGTGAGRRRRGHRPGLGRRRLAQPALRHDHCQVPTRLGAGHGAHLPHRRRSYHDYRQVRPKTQSPVFVRVQTVTRDMKRSAPRVIWPCGTWNSRCSSTSTAGPTRAPSRASSRYRASRSSSPRRRTTR